MRAFVLVLLALFTVACGVAPTPIPTPTPTAIPTPTRPPTPTLAPFQLTAQAQYARQLATQGADREIACRFVADIYRRHGQTFDRTRDAQLIIAEVRVLEGLDDIGARNSRVGKTLDTYNTDHILRCTSR